jgi:hypothetical protein
VAPLDTIHLLVETPTVAVEEPAPEPVEEPAPEPVEETAPVQSTEEKLQKLINILCNYSSNISINIDKYGLKSA